MTEDIGKPFVFKLLNKHFRMAVVMPQEGLH